MSPFAIAIKRLRTERQIQQREAAKLLGFEQSYLSALESGAKGPPKIDFIHKITREYGLDEEEAAELTEAWQHSMRTISLPRNADIDDYEIWYALQRQMAYLKPIQKELIKKMLAVNDYFAEGK